MDKGKANPLIKTLVVVTYLIMIVVNILANVIPINGVTTGEVSDNYPNLFTPAPYTFAIWGLIYLLLICYTIFQLGLFRFSKSADAAMINKVGLLFSLSSLANTLWVFAWHYGKITLSVLFMLAILICLILIFKTVNKDNLTLSEKLFVKLPFTVYFGWITVATIANITVWLVSIGWNGLGLSEATWTAIILLVGAVIGILVLSEKGGLAYGVVLIWAYIGILVKHISPNGWDMKYPLVIYTDIFCIALITALTVSTVLKHMRLKRSGHAISGV